MSGLREEQDELREELRPYEAGTLRVHEGPSGGKLVDITNKRIKQIKAEIASLERRAVLPAVARKHAQ